MTVQSRAEAWKKADELFPADYEQSARDTERAGYPIYVSTVKGCNAWISDLGNSFEINLDDGSTVRIWIEEPEEEQPTEAEQTIIDIIGSGVSVLNLLVKNCTAPKTMAKLNELNGMLICLKNINKTERFYNINITELGGYEFGYYDAIGKWHRWRRGRKDTRILEED